MPRLISTLLILLAAWAGLWFCTPPAQAADQPNILWITCEDISPHIGCYGDDYAVTPNIDRLATQGVRYTQAFAPIGVCAPARSCLITGMYPPSLGSQHMRCKGTLPEFVKCFPEYLRAAGYYCTNNAKTDYNFNAPKTAWDDSSGKAHYRNRKPGQPFFSIFNFTSCHESQIRLGETQYQKRVANFKPGEKHDPDKATVPPYHPNTPETRKDWARYADMITYMDKQVGELLEQLEADGLADSTIVCYYSDHGAGMPRSKRWLYDSSLHVPLIFRFPQKYAKLAPSKPGTTTDRLVSFVDFAPTALSLAGVKIPDHMQGEAFLGEQNTDPRQYIYGYRDRMDERYDMIRAVRDSRYKYIRNFQPQLPWFHSQYISYMYQMPTMKVWQQMADAGELKGATAVFMAKSKPTEELYDTQADPHEVNNLADSPEHQQVLNRLRQANRDWMLEIVDLGLLPEPDLRTRYGSEAPYSAVRDDPNSYPIERILETALLAGDRTPENAGELTSRLTAKDPAIRYWAAMGLGMLGEQAADSADQLTSALEDKSSPVRVAAADALLRMGRDAQALPVLANALQDPNEWTRLMAANVLDRVDDRAEPVADSLRAAKKGASNYLSGVLNHALTPFERKP